MTLDGVESILANTCELCRRAGTGEDALAKAERAVALQWKLVGQGIVRLTSDLEDKLVTCEGMLNAARAASIIDTTQTRDARSRTDVRMPLDVLGVILDQLEAYETLFGKKTTLCSLALCNKTFHSLAQPRLFNRAKLHTFPHLLHFAYALELQPKDSKSPLLVKSLSLAWDFQASRPAQPEEEAQLSVHRLIRSILATCPFVTALELLRDDEKSIDQSDVDALDGFLRVATQLESLAFHFSGDVCQEPIFGAEDPSIAQVNNPCIIFPKGTTDRMRQLRSFTLQSISDHGWGWPVFVQCFGPALRRIHLHFDSLQPGQLLNIAKSSPHLVEVVLLCDCLDTYANISRFINAVGPSLTHFELNVEERDDQPDLPSLLFESLKVHARSIEVCKMSIWPIKEDDLRTLTHPACLPRLRELTLYYLEHDTAACDEIAAGIIQSHKTTLEKITIGGDRFLLGNNFVRACLQLDRACYIDIEEVRYAQETNLALLERLYRSQHQLHPPLLQEALHRLRAQSPCSACLLVNGVIVSTHTLQECPEAIDVNLEGAQHNLWPEAEEHGYCAQCLLRRPLCLQLGHGEENGEGCLLESITRPLITFLAAQDPSWNTVGEKGEPVYWTPLLRSLLRIERAPQP